MNWEDKGHIGCLIIVILYVIMFIVCCFKSEPKQKEIHTISDEEKYIADSIAYENRLKAIREEEELERLRIEKEEQENVYTLAIIGKSDSTYHTTTKCDSLMLYNRKNFSLKEYRLTTIYGAKLKGYKICISCKEHESVLRKYEEGEIVNYEDVPRIAFEEFDMIETRDDDDDYDDWEYRDYNELY